MEQGLKFWVLRYISTKLSTENTAQPEEKAPMRGLTFLGDTI